MEMYFNLMWSNQNVKNNRKKKCGFIYVEAILRVSIYFYWFTEAIGQKLLTPPFDYVWPLRGR